MQVYLSLKNIPVVETFSPLPFSICLVFGSSDGIWALKMKIWQALLILGIWQASPLPPPSCALILFITVRRILPAVKYWISWIIAERQFMLLRRQTSDHWEQLACALIMINEALKLSEALYNITRCGTTDSATYFNSDGAKIARLMSYRHPSCAVQRCLALKSY